MRVKCVSQFAVEAAVLFLAPSRSRFIRDGSKCDIGVRENIVNVGSDVVNYTVSQHTVSCTPGQAAAAEDGVEGRRRTRQGQLRTYRSTHLGHEERSKRYERF